MVRSLGVPIAGRSSTGGGRDESSDSPSPSRGRGPYRGEFGPDSIKNSFSESKVTFLRSYYKILHDFIAVAPYSGEKIDRPPSGSIAVY